MCLKKQTLVSCGGKNTNVSIHINFNNIFLKFQPVVCNLQCVLRPGYKASATFGPFILLCFIICISTRLVAGLLCRFFNL